MNNRIIINIEVMKEIASCSRKAFASIDECANTLNIVLTHEDWCCKEKEQINICISTIKANSLELRESFDLFSTAVNNTAEKYIEMVNSEQNRILEINQTLGNMYSYTGSNTNSIVLSGNTTNAIISNIDNKQSSAFSCNSIFNLNNPIQIAHFSEVSEIISGAERS